MQTAVEVHMAQKYRISDKNDKEVFDFLKQNFGCNRKVYNLCVDSLYAQLEKAGYQAGDDIPGVKFPKMYRPEEKILVSEKSRCSGTFKLNHGF